MPDDTFSPPLVSVVMITYNRGDLIEESVRSVMAQTYENWELIIVDDGSEDDTEQVIDRLSSPKIRYTKINHCGLLGKVRNLGMKMATGKYIAFQDSDDLWLPNKLDVQVELLKRFPEAAFVMSNSQQFGENAWPVPDYDSLFVGSLFLPMLMERRFHFCGTSLLFEKYIVDKIGFLDEEVRMMRELQFFLLMSANYPGIFTNERLVKVRRHAKNTSASYNTEAHRISIKMFADFLKKELLSKKDFKELTSESYYRIGIEELRENQPSAAIKAFLHSTILDPCNLKKLTRLFQALLFSGKNLLYKTTTTS
jgi:glycosyltransferase involved in cell wall biosynthesis